MFYLFHHMPKCGGTSFNAFLASVFRVTPDYVGADHLKNPERFETYKANPVDLSELGPGDCLAGHYNLKGIRLKERYPMLDRIPHRMFSLLRDPFETAESGVRFGIHRGWISKDISQREHIDLVLARANYFSRTFGITSAHQIDALFARYWFIAPLDRMDDAMALIERAAGRTGEVPPVLNRTEPPRDPSPQSVRDAFRERSELDYALYAAASARFDALVPREPREPAGGRAAHNRG